MAKIKKYLDGGCDIETRNLVNTCLRHYLSTTNLSEVRKIYTDTAALPQKLQCGFNALHYASQAGHLDVVSLLLRRGAKIDAINEVCLMRHDLKSPNIDNPLTMNAF